MKKKNQYSEYHICTPGCFYRTGNKKILKQILATNNFLWVKTVYVNRKWWEFWKIKKVLYYELMCIR